MRNCLASLAHHLGGLHRVERVVSMTGYVAAVPEFTAHPAVLDGASDELLASVHDPEYVRGGVANLSRPQLNSGRRFRRHQFFGHCARDTMLLMNAVSTFSESEGSKA